MAQILARALFLIFCLSISVTGFTGKWVTPYEKDLKLGRQVTTLNKPPTEISKNTPVTHLVGSTKAATHDPLCSQDNGCNEGRFVLERFSMEGKTRNRSDSNSHPNDSGYDILNHWAAVQQELGQYYGAKATLNVYGLPGVGDNQGSAALIWVVSGLDTGDFNAIKAGWHVYPPVYGDHDTHFFVFWTVDENHKTGCYNLRCKGFVLNKSTNYVPGNILRPLSTYNGQQRFITLKISKDQQTGDWWLHAGPNADNPVGYWPKSLFTSLTDHATTIQWGGVVGFHKDQKTPPMGSGHFPSEGQGKAASMLNLKVVSEDGTFDDPDYVRYQDKPECYQISGDNPLFGGPGGCTD